MHKSGFLVGMTFLCSSHFAQLNTSSKHPIQCIVYIEPNTKWWIFILFPSLFARQTHSGVLYQQLIRTLYTSLSTLSLAIENDHTTYTFLANIGWSNKLSTTVRHCPFIYLYWVYQLATFFSLDIPIQCVQTGVLPCGMHAHLHILSLRLAVLFCLFRRENQQVFEMISFFFKKPMAIGKLFSCVCVSVAIGIPNQIY